MFNPNNRFNRALRALNDWTRASFNAPNPYQDFDAPNPYQDPYATRRSSVKPERI